jgi:DNA polymerase IIIc chi subunit
MAEKTATEWLFEQLWNSDKDKFVWHSLLEQAKEMEKQLIMSAFTKGEFFSSDYFDVCAPNKDCSENYYKETFKK